MHREMVSFGLGSASIEYPLYEAGTAQQVQDQKFCIFIAMLAVTLIDDINHSFNSLVEYQHTWQCRYVTIDHKQSTPWVQDHM